MYIYCQRNVGKIYNIKIANKSLEKVIQLEYIEMTLKYKNCIHEEIKENLIWECMLQFIPEPFLTQFVIQKHIFDVSHPDVLSNTYKV